LKGKNALPPFRWNPFITSSGIPSASGEPRRRRGDLFLEHGAYRYRLAFDCEACEMSLVDPLEKREPEGV